MLQEKVKELFKEQLQHWNLAHTNYIQLKDVRTKSIDFEDFEVKVQFNRARIVSSRAKVDSKSISERKCFLCTQHLPAEQNAIEYGDYSILVNPFPILPEHFTIPRKEHTPQQIKPYYSDMLKLAKELKEYIVFYNGPGSGASAPDHMHFQAGTKNFLPLIKDYKRLKKTHTELLESTDQMQLFKINNYLRTVYCIEAVDIDRSEKVFQKLYKSFENAPSSNSELEKDLEPMMNIVCSYENNKWLTFIFPRKAFRPWQYSALGDQQLLVSPGTVEMSGIFIAPIETHFDRIEKKDIISIFEQITLP